MNRSRMYSFHVVIPLTVALCAFSFGVVHMRQDNSTAGLISLFLAVISVVFAMAARVSGKIDDLREELMNDRDGSSNNSVDSDKE